MASDLFPDTILIRPDILSRLDFAVLFGNTAPVELELGAGDGSFLLQYSAAHPEVNFLGVERLFGRLRKIDRKGRRQGLKNLRGLRLEATYLMGWMIAPASLSAIHVYFPDPWPKKRHHRRRLINPAFAALAAQSLRPGGRFHCRTDDASYFEQMLEVFNGATEHFLPGQEPEGLLEVKTDFEREFNAQGIPTRHATWVRR
ncbi:MAG: tRNA (guanosine(46)-N7)-methyltransferase TrmB [Pedosphaera sp.]|nr:tRNA (guanosine(46)-N7)-methyltransferase TrmB [Pedosphaera sp.]